MPKILTIEPQKKNIHVFGLGDVLSAVDEHMGHEITAWLEDYIDNLVDELQNAVEEYECRMVALENKLEEARRDGFTA